MAHAVSGLWEVIRNYYRGDTGNDDEGVEEEAVVRGVKKRKKRKQANQRKVVVIKRHQREMEMTGPVVGMVAVAVDEAAVVDEAEEAA